MISAKEGRNFTRIIAIDVGMQTGLVCADIDETKRTIKIQYAGTHSAKAAERLDRLLSDHLLVEMPVLNNQMSMHAETAVAGAAWLEWAKRSSDSYQIINASQWKTSKEVSKAKVPKRLKSKHEKDAYRIILWFYGHPLTFTE